MCVINIYVDRYPDGSQVHFQKISKCPYGSPDKPCLTYSTLEHPVRNIQWGETTTQFLLTRPASQTPPQSPGGSRHRAHDRTSSEETKHRRLGKLKPHRQHRKERIVIVDPPAAPSTPPQIFPQIFTAPPSPVTPPRTLRGRPVIVDDRRPLRPRAISVAAVVGDRPQRIRSRSRPRFGWDSPSTSHTSFDSRARLEREELEKQRRELEREEHRRHQWEAERQARLHAEVRRAQRIAEQNEEIRRRAALPAVPSAPQRQRAFLRPVVTQSEALHTMMDSLVIDDRLGDRVLAEAATDRILKEDRDRLLRDQLGDEAALKQRLRDRQMPGRRVTPSRRRQTIVYDDWLYR